MIVAGIDYSTSSPAITITDTSKGGPTADNILMFSTQPTKCRVGTFKDNTIIVNHIGKFPYPEFRNEYLAKWAVQILIDMKVDEINIEEYAVRAIGRITTVAENTGLLKYHMRKAGLTWIARSIKTIKRDFCGNGNAKKEQMIDAFVEKTGIHLNVDMNLKHEYDKPIDDLVDSYAIMCMSDNVEMIK